MHLPSQQRGFHNRWRFPDHPFCPRDVRFSRLHVVNEAFRAKWDRAWRIQEIIEDSGKAVEGVGVQAGGSEMEIYHILESHYLPQQPSLIPAMIEQI